MSSPRILINGAKGRMGLALLATAKELGLTVSAALDQGDDLAAALPSADVVVDFSHHSVTAGLIELAIRHGKALVVGTTGHSFEEKAKLSARVAAAIPCVWTGNYSVGVNLLYHLTAEAARVLDSSYDAEVIEMHHRFKKDAPSGTAANLVEVLMRARDLNETDLRYGRQGITGERTKREIGIHSLRGGDVVGDHTVVFAALGERVELTHKASDRGIFARGALHAAVWSAGRPAGLYDMQDVLGFRKPASTS
ncbi:MAG: 4-hydroxy-tetrahydrodipicolinate reductase [Opitutaceae bacterium]|nr:4-hydroxy-tetrahydrodipicolinate reductase [Opitutaceae bacterium]